MRLINIAFLLGILSGLIACQRSSPYEAEAVAEPSVKWSADMQAVADGTARFAFDLYGKLREQPGNLFFPPYSAHTALTMTATGARGSTREQMVKVLHLPADERSALAAGDLARHYARPRKDLELSVASALWGQT